MLAVLRGAGIPDEAAVYFGNSLGRFLDASVLEASMAVGARNVEPGVQETGDMMREYWARLPADRFPNLTAVADVTFAADTETLFEFGLDLLVRGLAAYEASR
jgi:hypothetical protein